MEILIKRKDFSDKSTIGDIEINGLFCCYSLEDTNRDLNKTGNFDQGEKKIYGVTAIPYGIYEIGWRVSPHWSKKFENSEYDFKKLECLYSVDKGLLMPEIMNIPEFTEVMIHPANTPEQLLGCIAPGMTKGVNSILNSIKAFFKIMQKLNTAVKNKEKISLTII